MSRIVQMLDSYAYGDAIGNHVTTIHRELEKRGIESKIYANLIDNRIDTGAQGYDAYTPHPDDTILYHLSTGTDKNRKVVQYSGRLLINYHNITPPHFFHRYSPKREVICAAGYEDAVFLKDYAQAVISDSEYNSQELKKMGYTCPLHSVPIFMDFNDYDKVPDPEVMEKFGKEKGTTNIVFVGRIAPNKKQEDVIQDFYYYTKYFNPNSRLIMVGNYNDLETYYLELKSYVRKLGLKNVIFPGHIKFSEILAYYRTADLFLCESEHEGFCVPLVEAMYFGVPIVAYDSSAIGETLGGAGILLKQKDPKLTAAVMDQVIRDPQIQDVIRQKQKENLLRFRHETVAEAYMKILLGE